MVVNLLSCARATLSKVKVNAVMEVEVAFGMNMKNALIAVILVTAAIRVGHARLLVASGIEALAGNFS